METPGLRFACTQCGKCCNRSPEVELSEAAALADLFVFRLMFRIYSLPQELSDYLAQGDGVARTSAAFFGEKRLLETFSARKDRAKLWRGGKPIRCTNYLVVSALPLDTRPGTCSALEGTRCSIYDRRPLSCRSVPFHYSRAEAVAESDLRSFVGTAGYACDTGEAAPVAIAGGRITAAEANAARSAAVAAARSNHRWREAIVRRMNVASPASYTLPSVREVEANAPFGATTTSMRAAWQIAADVSLIDTGECDRLTALQLLVIDKELGRSGCPEDARETLLEMRSEYRHHLNRGGHGLA